MSFIFFANLFFCCQAVKSKQAALLAKEVFRVKLFRCQVEEKQAQREVEARFTEIQWNHKMR